MSLFWLQHQASVRNFYQGGSGPAWAAYVASLTPTAWWRMGDVSGGAVDSSNSNDLTEVGTLTYSEAGWTLDDDDAISFAGADNYLTASDAAWCEPGTSDWSISWVSKFSSWPAGTEEVASKDNAATAGEWGVYFTSTADRVVVVLDTVAFNIDMSTADLLDDGSYHHCVVTCDRDDVATLYVDGSSEGTVDISSKSAADLSNAVPLYVGYGYSGTFDEIIWWKDRLLTFSEVSALYASRSGTGGGEGGSQSDTYAQAVIALAPVAYYKMDEGDGPTMTDSSVTGNDGSYNGSVTYGAPGPFVGATGVTFSGAATQWAEAPYNAALDTGTGDWSFVIWMKSAATWDTGDGPWIMARGSDQWDGKELVEGQTANELQCRFGNVAEDNSMWANSDTTGTLHDDAWHMVAICADRDGSAYFYLDGSAYGSEVISSFQHEASGNYKLYLARRLTSGNEFTGTLCQAAFFDKLLDSTDITGLWTAAGN